ncbi:unnamed protein product, partial [Symbiodinium microadriaticum]
MFLDITTFACSPMTQEPLDNGDTEVATEQTGADSMHSIPPQQHHTVTGAPKKSSFGFAGFMSNIKESFQDTTSGTSTTPSSKSQSLSSPFPVIGFIKKNFLTAAGAVIGEDVSDKFAVERKAVVTSLVTTIRAIRAAVTLLLEKLREKSKLRREVLLFMMKNKCYFFRQLPPDELTSRAMSAEKVKAAEREYDMEFTACLTFYFYQCMLEDDLSYRAMAMKCWGDMFRSELGQHANALLHVQVSKVTPGDVVMMMKIDLWRYERGGMYLLEELAWSGMVARTESSSASANTLKNFISQPAAATTTAAPTKSIEEQVEIVTNDEAYIAFLQWMDDLPEEVRDAFEEKICAAADKFRHEVVAMSSDLLRFRRERWKGYHLQLQKHSREIHTYIAHLHALKKRDLKVLQRMMLFTLRGY